MSNQYLQSKYKIGDVVSVGYVKIDGTRILYPGSATITEVIYDLDKHTPDTHMYVVQGEDSLSGLWFESELTLCVIN